MFWEQLANSDLNLEGLLENINSQIVNPIILLLMGAGLIVFLYGLVEMIQGADNEEARKKGQQHMVWGIIGLFIMVAVFGIINVIISTISAISG
ncbi:MAG TPA: hypothetical protein ENN31_01390 [Candidatus Vogelbacteria bacterium]|nr:hypothetical protein [Candidatus Vogelbacteria bacterium]